MALAILVPSLGVSIAIDPFISIPPKLPGEILKAIYICDKLERAKVPAALSIILLRFKRPLMIILLNGVCNLHWPFLSAIESLSSMSTPR